MTKKMHIVKDKKDMKKVRKLLSMETSPQFRSRLNNVQNWSGDTTYSATIRRLVNAEYIKMRKEGLAEDIG